MLPSDENEASNQARNFLFELNLAARLWRAGFAPRLGEHPDLVCEVKSKTLFFECKRPYARSKIRKRINLAGKQLRSDLERAGLPGARGVIAISLSKILNPGDRLLVTPNEVRGRQALERALEAAAERVRDSWIKFRGTNIIGILFHSITPVLEQEANIYAVGQQIVGYSLAVQGSRDDEAMNALADALEAVQF